MSEREEREDREEEQMDVVATEAAPAPAADSTEATIEAMKARVAEMEKEAAKLRELQADAAVPAGPTDKEREEIDARSVYVGNVDYASTPEEIQAHFASSGTINRVTILFDKFTGPKGFAYVEFAEPASVQNAVLLNDTTFRGRLLKVSPKRTNVPGLKFTSGRGRGRGGFRGGRGRGYSPYRGRGRGGYRGRGGFY